MCYRKERPIFFTVEDYYDYEEYCHKFLPREYDRLVSMGRTGTEAFIAAETYNMRKMAQNR